MNNLPTGLLAAAAIVGACSAQQSLALQMSPAAVLTAPSVPFGTTLTGTTNTPFAVYVDIDGGPVDLLGERLYLGLSSFFLTFDAGVSPVSSTRVVNVPLFPGLAGLVLHAQAIVLDPTAPNGLFRTSNPSSTTFFASSYWIIETFEGSFTQRFAGSYATDVPGHIGGGPVTTRTVDTTFGAIPFAPGAVSPLQPFGCREQVVFRADDLGANGTPELLSAFRWRSATPVGDDTFGNFELRLGHSDVVPDFTVDPFSMLPKQPDSGLSETFSDNQQPGSQTTTVFAGQYAINAAAMVEPDLVSIPLFAWFEYDGTSSLLLDFRVDPGLAQGVNAIRHTLAVASAPQPYTRVVAAGVAQQPILPDFATQGNGDNAMPEFQLEFTRTQTEAVSTWRSSFAPQPDYHDPIVAKSLPFGTSIELAFQGADDPNGSNATPWSSSQDVADGRDYLRYRITFHANPFTREVPQIDTIVIPVN